MCFDIPYDLPWITQFSFSINKIKANNIKTNEWGYVSVKHYFFWVCVLCFCFHKKPRCVWVSSFITAYFSRKDLSLDSDFMEFPSCFRLEANRNSNHAISALPHHSAEATGMCKISSVFCRHWDPNFDYHPWGASTINLGTISLALNKTFLIKLKTI